MRYYCIYRIFVYSVVIPRQRDRHHPILAFSAGNNSLSNLTALIKNVLRDQIPATGNTSASNLTVAISNLTKEAKENITQSLAEIDKTVSNQVSQGQQVSQELGRMQAHKLE